MKSKLYAAMAAVALACAMSLPAVPQDRDDKKPTGEKHEGMEQHPEIASAMNHLREAKQNLEHAAHDFGGHRAEALKHVNQALEECRQAMAYDKK